VLVWQIQRNKRRLPTCSSSGDVVLQDLDTGAAEHGPDSEHYRPPPTLASLAQRNAETGNSFRRYAGSSTCGCWSEQLERRLARTLSKLCETLDRGERRQETEDRRTSNHVARTSAGDGGPSDVEPRGRDVGRRRRTIGR